jgi:hypothetical protein
MKGKSFILTALLTGLGTFLSAHAGIVFSPATLPSAGYGAAYTQTLTVTGGRPPYTFTISSGRLPAGITLSPAGVLFGTATAAGKFTFTIKAQGKGGGPGPRSGTANYTLTVDPASLTITADNKTMPLGGPLPILTASYTGFVNRDNASSLTTLPTIITSVSLSSPAGIYPIAVSGAKDPNYNFSYVSGTLTISAGTVHVTANPQTKVYGAPDPTFTYIFTGLPNSDSTSVFTGSLSRAKGEDVGSYPISIGSLKAGGGRMINFTASNLTITKATQQITWAQSPIVGCNTTSNLTLTAAASSELPVTYTVSDPSVASVSGNILTFLKPGAVAVTAAQSGNADYKAAPAITDTILFQSTSLITQHWNDAIFFDNSSGNYVQWQWYKNGDAVKGDTTPYYSETPSLNGQYYVIATNKDGQQVQSCTLSITPGAAIPGGIKVAPNPAAKGALATIVCNYSAAALQGALIQITDIKGRILQQITNVQPSTPVTMPNANGIYIVNLLLPNGQRIATNIDII